MDQYSLPVWSLIIIYITDLRRALRNVNLLRDSEGCKKPTFIFDSAILNLA